MESIQNTDLIDLFGEKIQAKVALKGKKYILYYFSASFCDPCEKLLPKLKEIHAEAIKRNIPFEIVYISLDSTEEEMLNYFKMNHGNWYAVQFEDVTANSELLYRFGVTSIPHIVVVKNNDLKVTKNGKAEVEKLGINVLVTWIS